MNKGTIVLARFPFTDLSASKRRPALVLTSNNPESPDVILAFISSVIPDNLRIADLFLDSKDQNFHSTGLRKSSIIKLDKLATLDKELISGEMGALHPSMMKSVIEKLKTVLELE